MEYKTIQVSMTTWKRLMAFKAVSGLPFGEIIDQMIDGFDPQMLRLNIGITDQ